MADVVWNEEKNKLLKKTRKIGFEKIERAIAKKQILDIFPHPNKKRYINQKIMLVNIKNYIYAVPFIEKDYQLFLKTIYASRKYTRKYLKRRNK
ncbi:MAG: hypothetical protein UY17_C0005G0010 [Candidatus Beckwithbacteria bacterium GW2011_GWC2_47_9]|uniref:Toxin n=3 Tax=Candidatus Beckwithiibacteriota TaxID=1752726 RepID=A0A0G1U1M8_9BACT|nr:MAG: hypothetical protein UY17_C0005G0010 [Candidatus Beckwithbacteria bacterium GW2011_GWC2_47_9]OGD55712.1 MAG: toxin [Candidatus Beckwithbacteria bacterium RIFCSPHIGHO2_12_FULL_47_17]OGD59952.1 MAG: toxin [Candidatus Beckwithbacteria bacterium RIFCSPLOWO2_02_FULL_47_23]